MKRIVKQDPFFDKQPPLSFVEELKKPLHAEKPAGYGTRTASEKEIDASGIYLAELYADDPDNLLETIYTDFEKFTTLYEIAGKRFPVYLKKEATDCFETHTIKIAADGVTITANDTEGIRRGLIYLEDELRRREGAYLEPGELTRTPKIHSRITRCFFSPINRPPKFGDELSDDIDYYPEEYLNRLMHDGANGVWIYTRFADILPSSIIKENGQGYEKRIAKLNRVIDKCARYGIGVYVFAIEPVALKPEQLEKYPELAGTTFSIVQNMNLTETGATFCANSEAGKRYCYEAGVNLVTLAPKLKGYISITTGERLTSCSSILSDCNCPRCSKKKPGQVLSDAVEALRSGIRDTKPECETVSWTYGHRMWNYEDITDYVKTAPDDVMLMQSFEEMGYEEQLGKVRQLVDYWLSYVGPSEMFQVTAEEAQKSGKEMFAKMQVCCSHEIASVPYVPVPGILYKKYAKARALDVTGIMQCWYFGNYPSLMSKAAGELAFVEKFDNEDGFLRSLAGIYWGNSKADTIVKMWKEFEAGYSNYPRNIMFSYYGPMHDSVVWKLALKPKNFSLPRSWQTLDPIDGDRIGESMMDGHDIDEVLTLLDRMSSHWNKGLALLSELKHCGADEEEQISIAKTIGLLFASGRNVIEFYLLREQLGLQKGDAKAILEKMRHLVTEEIENSRRMIPLCNNDSRLGYHSEGEGYKFFPEKIEDRIAQLEELLKTEFVEVEARINEGLAPLEFYEGVEDHDSIKSYHLTKGSIEDAEWEMICDETDSKFRMSYDEENLYFEMSDSRRVQFIFSPEFRLLWPSTDVYFQPDGTTIPEEDAPYYSGLFKDSWDGYFRKFSDIKVLSGTATHLLVTVKRKDVNLAGLRPFKIKLVAGDKSWCKEENPVSTLGKCNVTPGDFGWIFFDTKN